MSVLYNI